MVSLLSMVSSPQSWTANAIENSNLLIKHGELTSENGAYIVTQQFLDSFLVLSGSGITFGLVIAMLFAANSQQYKALGKVAAFPTILMSMNLSLSVFQSS